jgi:hypothetical protein
MLSMLVDLFYSSLPFRIAVGLLVGLLSTLYSQRNRHAASQDALAYAARTRLQKEAATIAAEEREIQERANQDNPSAALKSSGAEVCNNASEENDNKKPTEGSERTAEDGEGVQQDQLQEEDESADEDIDDMADTTKTIQWRCACQGGFLPAGLLQSLGGAEAVFRMGTGQCYHKQT